ncbi:hypothetical protein N665_2581s0004 [Sinapis alba]|nr:hypothetical protein N665_2581s0004 [Sinapis alba]
MDVKEKLLKMKADSSDERLKMAVLYFLARVIRRRSKGGYFIEPFILQAVDDLDFVNTFPWSRYTFDGCMKEIFHMRDHFLNGIPEKTLWVFHGFINPLEVITQFSGTTWRRNRPLVHNHGRKDFGRRGDDR